MRGKVLTDGGMEWRCVLVVTHRVDPVVRHIWLNLGRDNIRFPHHLDVVLKKSVQQREKNGGHRRFPNSSEVEECVARTRAYGWFRIHLLFLVTFNTSMAR